MLGIKYFPHNLNVEKKTIILRVDLNVPLSNKKILDSTRIEQALPFLQDLLKKKAKIRQIVWGSGIKLHPIRAVFTLAKTEIIFPKNLTA